VIPEQAGEGEGGANYRQGASTSIALSQRMAAKGRQTDQQNEARGNPSRPGLHLTPDKQAGYMTATEFQIASAIQPLTRAGSIYAWRREPDLNRIDTLAHKSEGTNATLQERFSRCQDNHLLTQDNVPRFKSHRGLNREHKTSGSQFGNTIIARSKWHTCKFPSPRVKFSVAATRSGVILKSTDEFATSELGPV
jgi:hypothetical protein